MKEFILVDKFRIRKSSIKRYFPIGIKAINFYYSSSRNKPDFETITLNTPEERDEVIIKLDTHFIL